MANGYSLHIGLKTVDKDHYAGWSGRLDFPEKDAAAMQALCQARGFQAQLLRGRAATRSSVLSAIAAIAQQASAGDVFIVSYAGHGAELPNANGDSEKANDQTWCLFDAQLIDDELRRAWGAFAKGVRVVVISDSCFSGSIVRKVISPVGVSYDDADHQSNIGLQSRLLPREILSETLAANAEFYNRLMTQPAPPPPQCSVIQLAACTDGERAYEGFTHGLFTGALLSLCRDRQFTGNYAQLVAKIGEKVRRFQTPTYLEDGFIDPANARLVAFTF